MKKRRFMIGIVALLPILAGGAAALHVATAQLTVQTVVLGNYPSGDAMVDDRAGLVFVTAGDGLHALDAATGSPRYRIHTAVGSLLAIDRRAGRLFVAHCCASDGSQDVRVLVLDVRTGRLVHALPFENGAIRAVVDERRGRAVILATRSDSGSGYVSVLDTHSGRLLRTQDVGVFPDSIGVDDRTGHAFVTAFDAGWEALVFDTRNGVLRRRTPLDATPGATTGAIAVDVPAGRAFIATPDSASVAMLDTPSGALARTSIVGAGPLTLALDPLAQRVFAVSVTDGTMSVLDEKSGTLLRTVLVGQTPGAPRATGQEQRVFIAIAGRARRVCVIDAASGTVSTFDTRGGAPLRAVPVGANPIGVAVDNRTGRVFVATSGPTDRAGNPTGRGAISVLDARTGVVLRTVPVGINPIAVTIVERTGRVFVVNNGGSIPAPDRWGWVPTWLRQRVPALTPQAPSACLIFNQRGLPTPSAACTTEPGSVSVLDATR